MHRNFIDIFYEKCKHYIIWKLFTANVYFPIYMVKTNKFNNTTPVDWFEKMYQYCYVFCSTYFSLTNLSAVRLYVPSKLRLDAGLCIQSVLCHRLNESQSTLWYFLYQYLFLNPLGINQKIVAFSLKWYSQNSTHWNILVACTNDDESFKVFWCLELSNTSNHEIWVLLFSKLIHIMKDASSHNFNQETNNLMLPLIWCACDSY